VAFPPWTALRPPLYASRILVINALGLQVGKYLGQKRRHPVVEKAGSEDATLNYLATDVVGDRFRNCVLVCLDARGSD